MAHVAQFDAFVPALVRRRLAQGPSFIGQPSADSFPASVLFADLSGFSTLAERLAERGPRGAEDLKDLLNLFFGRLVDLVHRHGGQVVSFPGDAALALWPASTGSGSHRVAWTRMCALEAQRAFLSTERARRPQVSGSRVGAGVRRRLGRECRRRRGRWHLLVTGDSLAQAVLGAPGRRPGEVVVSTEAWQHLPAPHATSDSTGRASCAPRAERAVPSRVAFAGPSPPRWTTPRFARTCRARFRPALRCRSDRLACGVPAR